MPFLENAHVEGKPCSLKGDVKYFSRFETTFFDRSAMVN